jgi:ribosomal protein L37AE/L43A
MKRPTRIMEIDGVPMSLREYADHVGVPYSRLSRKRYSELSDEQRRKANSRSTANVAVRRGKLQIQPCEKCGASEAEKHHDDYSKPLDVRWLCRGCHMEHHEGPSEKHQEMTLSEVPRETSEAST